MKLLFFILFFILAEINMSWFKDLMAKGAKQPQMVDAPAPKKKPVLPKVKVDLVNSQHLFYDLLFGDSVEPRTNNNLELLVIARADEILINPKLIKFTSFPKALKETLDKIEKNCDTSQIQNSLEQDPLLASDVIRLVNTPIYNSSKKPITSLKVAINSIGLEMLKEIATTASINRMFSNNSIYFKMFGEKLWQHSLLTARISESKALKEGIDPYTAFFVGIVHELGKIALYTELVNAVSNTDSDEQLGSMCFRKSMTKLSKLLTYNIVRSWPLPKEIVSPLKEFVMYKKLENPSKLAKILVEATLLSELCLLFDAKLIDQDEALIILDKNNIELENIEYVIS